MLAGGLVVLLIALLPAVPLWAAPSAWAAQQRIGVVPAGTLAGHSRLIVDLPDARPSPVSPDSFSVMVSGTPQPTTAGPLMSDRLAMALVVDAAEAAAPVLQSGLSGLVDFALAASPATREALVVDASPPAVVTPLRPSQGDILRGLSAVQPHGDRQTAGALELAVAQLPLEPENPRLVVLYTAAAAAADQSAADLSARLAGAGVVLAVVTTASDGGPVPEYWSSVAAATGGVAVSARRGAVTDAFAELANALRTRYLLTIPAPDRFPANATVRVDSPDGPLTADTVLLASTPPPTAGTDAGRVIVVVALAFAVLAIALGALLVVRRVRPRGAATRADVGGAATALAASAATGSAGRSAEVHQTEAAARPETQGHPPLDRDKTTAGAERTAKPEQDIAAVWSIPARVEPVVDRQTVLAAISDGVRSGTPVALHGAGGGVAGVGRTTAMIEFAHRNRHQYDLAWWIAAEDPPLVADRMAELAQALGLARPSDTTAAATARLLAPLRRRDRWLLIFDDAASPAELDGLLPVGPGHVIISSADPERGKHGTSVPVPPFTRAESVALLRTRHPGLTVAEADRVATALQDLPLALDPAGATLAEARMTVASYLRLLAEHRASMSAESTATSAAWAIAFDRLAADDPPALALLTIVAWLAPEPVPLSLLREHPDLLPPPLAQSVRTPARLADLAATLRRRGIARVAPDSVALHRVPAAQLVVRTVEERPGDRGWAAWAVGIVRAAAPPDPVDPAGWPAWRQLLPHVVAATDPARPLDEVIIDVGWLLSHAASYLQARGEPRHARALFEDAYNLYRHRLGQAHPDTVASARALADNLHSIGRHEHARRVLQDTDPDDATHRPLAVAVRRGRRTSG